jgi:hypothetical protein
MNYGSLGLRPSELLSRVSQEQTKPRNQELSKRRKPKATIE